MKLITALVLVSILGSRSALADEVAATKRAGAPWRASAGGSKDMRITRSGSQPSQRGPAEWFTGSVRVDPLFQASDPSRASGASVTFEPGARSAWHTHPLGQVLIVTSGVGRVQQWGGPVEEIRAGDVVWTPPGVKHWHGASPTAAMTHIAIQEALDGKVVEWMDKVTDEQYGSLAACSAHTRSGQMEATRSRPVAHLTEAAVRNHEQLFPGYESKLRETDPELIAIFDNFAFDEVPRHASLDVKTRVMVILASTIASQALSEYEMMLGGALNVGVTPVEAKEILYHAIPYVGIAKVLDFIHFTNHVLQARGVELPLEAQSTTTPETRRARGLALQKELYGDRMDKMYEASPANQRHIQELLSANCFGDYWTRNGLDARTRELLTFSLLAALGGAEPQLKGHIQGNLNVGNDKEKLIAVVTQILPYIGYPRALSALQYVNEVIPEVGRSRSVASPATASGLLNMDEQFGRAATR